MWTLPGCGGSSDSTEVASTDAAANAGGGGDGEHGGGEHGGEDAGGGMENMYEGEEDNEGDYSDDEEDDGGGEHGGGGGMDAMYEGEDEQDNEGEYGGEAMYAAAGYGSGNGGRGRAAAKPKTPPRPANVEMWTEDNFKTAAADRDARVISALKAYAQAPAADADKVALFKSMLQALADGPAQPGVGQSGGQRGNQQYGSEMYEGEDDGDEEYMNEMNEGGQGGEHGAGSGQPKRKGASLMRPVGENVASVRSLLLLSTIGQNGAAISTRQRVGNQQPGTEMDEEMYGDEDNEGMYDESYSQPAYGQPARQGAAGGDCSATCCESIERS